jgi:hypothetical protein
MKVNIHITSTAIVVVTAVVGHICSRFKRVYVCLCKWYRDVRVEDGVRVPDAMRRSKKVRD